jgi:SpoVK/Ycf46/Vps4 family AAA+-type ATPase
LIFGFNLATIKIERHGEKAKMGITFKSFSKCVGYVTGIRKPVLLRSRHGVGKSSVVYAYAEQVGLPVIERRASQMTEGDLLGLPKVDEDCTRWLAPEWLKIASEQPVVLFIDEIDRATPEVRQGFFELTDSRKIAGLHLHQDTLVFAAVNGGDHASQYQVGEMDSISSHPLRTGQAGQQRAVTSTRLLLTSFARTLNTLSTRKTLSQTRFILQGAAGIG